MRPWGGPYFAVSLEWWIMNEWRNCLVFDSFVNFVAYILRRLAKQHNKSAHKIAKWIFIHIYLLLLHTSSSHSLSLSLNKSDFLYETYVVLKGSFLCLLLCTCLDVKFILHLTGKCIRFCIAFWKKQFQLFVIIPKFLYLIKILPFATMPRFCSVVLWS